jgi:hypothetical protein
LKEGGWDGEVSEKSFAMSPCGLFSYREEAELAPSTPAIGVARDEKLPKAGTSGDGWVYNARYGKPKRKFRVRPWVNGFVGAIGKPAPTRISYVVKSAKITFTMLHI